MGEFDVKYNIYIIYIYRLLFVYCSCGMQVIRIQKYTLDVPIIILYFIIKWRVQLAILES